MAEANIVTANQSKIDAYGIAEKVMELRQDLSLEDAAEVINAYHLPEGADPISNMAIMRWEKKNNVVYKRDTQLAIGVPTSAWTEMTNLKSRSYKHMQRVNKKLDSVFRLLDALEVPDDVDEKIKTKVKIGNTLSEVASLSTAYTTAIKTHQGIVEQQVKYEKEMLKTEQVKRVLNVILATLKEYPEVQAKFMARFREMEEFEIMNAL